MTIEVTLPSKETKSTSIFNKITDVLNPPTDKIIKGKEDDLYAADIFEAGKVVKLCRVTAFTVALTITISTFFMFDVSAPAIEKISGHTLSQITTLKPLITLMTFLITYPKLVQFFFNATIKTKLASKRENIDRNIYTVLCILSSFGIGGVPAGKAIELIAKSGLKGIKEEFMKIHTLVSILGYDLKSAMLKIALTTPSEKLSQFLKGFVSYLERSMNYGTYVNEYLQLDNINRRIELAKYNEKLKQLSAMYMTLIAMLSSLAVISLSMNITDPSYDYTPIIVYVVIPALSIGISILYYLGSPDKGMQKEKNKVAMYIAAILLTTALLATYVPTYNVKIALLASVTISALAAHIYIYTALKSDAKIEQELNMLLMNLYAASRSGESIVKILKTLGGELGEKLKRVVANSAVNPIGRCLIEESTKVKHPFLAALLYVLGNVVHNTHRYTDILTALIHEYHRFVEYSKLRKSITTTMAVIVLMALVLTAFCMGVVKVLLIPSLSGAIAKTQGLVHFDSEYAIRLTNDTVIALAATTPFVLSSISWDFRRSFKYFVFTSLIALGFVSLL